MNTSVPHYFAKCYGATVSHVIILTNSTGMPKGLFEWEAAWGEGGRKTKQSKKHQDHNSKITQTAGNLISGAGNR